MSLELLSKLETKIQATLETIELLKMELEEEKQKTSTLSEQNQQLSEQNQQLQQEQINNIDERNKTIIEQNDSLKGQNNQLQKDLQERDAKIKELESQVNTILNDLARKDSMLSGTKPSLPSDIVYDGGDDELVFITGEPEGNYFMVVGSFRIEQNSYNFQEQLTREGFKAGVVYDKKRKWYYVYLSQPDNWEKGLEQLFKLREENERFHDAWIHIMDKSFK